MSRHDKKKRHKAKRQAKRDAARRRTSISPIQRLAQARADVECWMSDIFPETGQMQIFTFKAAAGLAGVACFLIDRGVVGLKDAWARTNSSHEDLDAMLKESAGRGIRMRRVDVETVRRWVASAVRWAYENGMRLPKDWTRTASLIGGVGDWKSANLTGFIKEFAGHPDDLRQRLLIEPFETFIQRSDIHFMFNDQAPYLDEQADEYRQVDDPDLDDAEEFDGIGDLIDGIPDETVQELMNLFTPGAAMLAETTAIWLGARGETPSPGLNDAWRHFLLATALVKTAMPSATQDDFADLSFDLLEQLSAEVEPSQAAQLNRGITQVLDHLDSNPSLMNVEMQKQIAAVQPEMGPIKMFPDNNKE